MTLIPMSLQEQIGRQIRAKRNRQRLFQKELAGMVGTTQAVIARIENGRGNPTLDLIQRIVNALDLQGTLFIRPEVAEQMTPKWLSEPDPRD